jgi:hypothetical protein
VEKENRFKYPDERITPPVLNDQLTPVEVGQGELQQIHDRSIPLYVPKSREEADALIESAEAMVAEANQRPGSGKSGEYVLAEMRLDTARKEHIAYFRSNRIPGAKP